MYEFGQLIGFGIAPFGSFTYKDGGQEWFEHVPRRVAEVSNIIFYYYYGE